MNQIVSESTVAVLDRKYEFVINSPTTAFMPDLYQFLAFLTQDEMVKDFTFKVRQQFDERAMGYQTRLNTEKLMAIQIKDALIAKYPELDDSNAPPPVGLEDPFSWEDTFAHFNKVAAESYRRGYILEPDGMDDNTDVRKMLDVLSNKVGFYERRDEQGEKIREIDKEISAKVIDLESIHKHTHLEWKNYSRVSAGATLYGLEEIIKRINPEPEDQTEWRNLSLREKGNRGFAKYFEERNYTWVTDATYGVVSNYSNYRPNMLSPEQLERVFDEVKQQLKRVYEAVRQEMGTTRLKLQVLDRYRMRAHWYNQDHLRSLVLDSAGDFIKAREDVLTRDLALYIFDQGITVIYRARLGKHEVDLLELDAKQPMFIEVKAYKDASSKLELISGISQLHGYLSSLDAHKDISDAYYVMYRLGGPIYEFPRRISTSRFTVYPILVDLALSSESGRNQPKPIIVSEEEILLDIKKPATDQKTDSDIK
jgi:hypothetical protein